MNIIYLYGKIESLNKHGYNIPYDEVVLAKFEEPYYDHEDLLYMLIDDLDKYKLQTYYMV